jgi:hypothetical protein
VLPLLGSSDSIYSLSSFSQIVVSTRDYSSNSLNFAYFLLTISGSTSYSYLISDYMTNSLELFLINTKFMSCIKHSLSFPVRPKDPHLVMELLASPFIWLSNLMMAVIVLFIE